MANENTVLSPQEELAFRRWAVLNGISDVDHPQSKYDYRGFWKATNGAKHVIGEHFPDTFKQHGHPTFSDESQYAQGPWDAGRWIDESYVPQGADMLMNSRGQSRMTAADLAQALTALLNRR